MPKQSTSTHKGFCRRCREYDRDIRNISPKWCSECYSIYTKEWRSNHPEHKEKVRKAVIQYRTKHKHEKDYKEMYKAAKLKYRKTNKGKYVRAAENHKRRTNKTKAGGSYTLREWNNLLHTYGYKCLDCGCDNCKLTADHIIPVALGGTSNIDNIQPLCNTCNIRKGINDTDYRNKNKYRR